MSNTRRNISESTANRRNILKMLGSATMIGTLGGQVAANGNQTDEAEPDISLSNSEYTVDQGEDIRIDITATAGTEGLTNEEVEFMLNGSEYATKSVNAEAGETEEVSFSIDTSDDPVYGSNDLGVFLLDESDYGILRVEGADGPTDDEEDSDLKPNGDDKAVPDENGEDDEVDHEDEPVDSSSDDETPGFGVGSTVASIGGFAYLLQRRLTSDTE